jgi:hypothetical protein
MTKNQIKIPAGASRAYMTPGGILIASVHDVDINDKNKEPNKTQEQVQRVTQNARAQRNDHDRDR